MSGALDCRGWHARLTGSHTPAAAAAAAVHAGVSWVGPELGLFDPIDSQPLARLTPEHTIATPETKALNLKAAQQSLVLLHNAEVLPLRRGQTIAVIGPHAQAQRSLIQVDTVAVCETNGDFSCLKSPYVAIKELNTGGTTVTARGCDSVNGSTAGFAEALRIARTADVIVFAGGIRSCGGNLPGEIDGKPATPDPDWSRCHSYHTSYVNGDQHLEAEAHDRRSIDLPAAQHQLLALLFKLKKPLVLVLLNGGAVAIEEEMAAAKAGAPLAVVESFYPGARGSDAIAQSLFGVSNRFGRLPYTVYDKNWVNRTKFTEHDLTADEGRTYRFYPQLSAPPPIFPFGHGLSLTSFNISASPKSCSFSSGSSSSPCTITVTAVNSGSLTGDIVLTAFFKFKHVPSQAASKLRKQLFDFTRLNDIAAGQSQQTIFAITPTKLALSDVHTGDLISAAGSYELTFEDGSGGAAVVAVTIGGGDKTLGVFPAGVQPLTLETTDSRRLKSDDVQVQPSHPPGCKIHHSPRCVEGGGWHDIAAALSVGPHEHHVWQGCPPTGWAHSYSRDFVNWQFLDLGPRAIKETYEGMASDFSPCSGFATLDDAGKLCAGFRQCTSTHGSTGLNPRAQTWDVPLELRCADNGATDMGGVALNWSTAPRYLYSPYYSRNPLPYDPPRPWRTRTAKGAFVWRSVLSTHGCNGTEGARYLTPRGCVPDTPYQPNRSITCVCTRGGQLDLWEAPALHGPWHFVGPFFSNVTHAVGSQPLQCANGRSAYSKNGSIPNELVTTGLFGNLSGDPYGGRTVVVSSAYCGNLYSAYWLGSISADGRVFTPFHRAAASATVLSTVADDAGEGGGVIDYGPITLVRTLGSDPHNQVSVGGRRVMVGQLRPFPFQDPAAEPHRLSSQSLSRDLVRPFLPQYRSRQMCTLFASSQVLHYVCRRFHLPLHPSSCSNLSQSCSLCGASTTKLEGTVSHPLLASSLKCLRPSSGRHCKRWKLALLLGCVSWASALTARRCW